MYKILLIEDDLDICEIIKLYLSKTKYSVSVVNTAEEALETVEVQNYDLILLDIMLPDINGVELCKKLRKNIYSPIIFISCIDDDGTVVKALETGGDDYLVKPFNNSILIARIEANLRRVEIERKNISKKNIIDFKDFIIEPKKHLIIKNNKEIYLTPIEFKILIFMIENPNRILTLEEIYEKIWKEKSYDDVRTVKVHVSNLRKKIEQDASNPVYIQTIRRTGYIFKT